MLLIMAFKGGGWGIGLLGVLGIILGFVLIGSYGSLGSGLAMLWSAAVVGLVGGLIMIIQSFRMRGASA
jgi:uncharacterized membrane protein HdeD (DUF308 family)